MSMTSSVGGVTEVSGHVRRKPAEERRTDLLDAGLELFVEKGFAHTAVSEITARAGVAQGTFYLHFPSKQALLVALHDRFEERIVSRARAAIDAAGPSFPNKLDALVAACFADYEAELDQHDVLFVHLPREAFRRDDGVRSGESLAGLIAELLREGAAAEAFEIRDVEVTALLLFSALHGGFDEVVHIGPAIARDRLVPSLQDLFCRTVACAPPRRSRTANASRTATGRTAARR